MFVHVHNEVLKHFTVLCVLILFKFVMNSSLMCAIQLMTSDVDILFAMKALFSDYLYGPCSGPKTSKYTQNNIHIKYYFCYNRGH